MLKEYSNIRSKLMNGVNNPFVSSGLLLLFSTWLNIVACYPPFFIVINSMSCLDKYDDDDDDDDVDDDNDEWSRKDLQCIG